MKNVMNDDITNLGNPKENLKQKSSMTNEIVKDAIVKIHPELNQKQVDIAANELLKKNNNGKVKVGDVEIGIGDLAYSVALSVQAINSETSPQEEFYRWIDDAKLVISEMTDSNITESDLKHREDFLDNLDQREIEIKTCIALYQSAALYGNSRVREQAQRQLEFLQMKWAKLMELRSAVKNSTKSRLQVALEPEVSEEEHDKGKLYIMALYYMRKGLRVPERIKIKLGLMPAVDFNHTLSDKLLERKYSTEASKDDVIKRINILRGRQEPTYKPLLEVNRQHFSSQNFQRLLEQNATR